MHYGVFFAVIDGYIGEGIHPRKLLLHTGRKPGKVVVLGRHELVPSTSSGRECPVWHGEA